MKPKHDIQAIFDCIKNERDYQDKKYGRPQDSNMTIAEWQQVMLVELKESMESLNPVDSMREILQVVAVGVAAMEQHGCFERFEFELDAEIEHVKALGYE